MKEKRFFSIASLGKRIAGVGIYFAFAEQSNFFVIILNFLFWKIHIGPHYVSCND